MPEYAWPPPAERRLIGTRVARLDGPVKVTGEAKYTQDVALHGMLHARILHCPHAHARVRRLDVAAARRMPGVEAVRVVHEEGSEVQWAGTEIAVVAAASEAAAADAVRAIEVEYEVLPHFVDDTDLAAAPETEEAQSETAGDPDGAMERAAVRVSGRYGIPSISHNCLEPHGQVVRWDARDAMTAWASTQAVSAQPGQFAERLGVPASNVRVICQYIGGGFGSKFSVDRWGIECAELAR